MRLPFLSALPRLCHRCKSRIPDRAAVCPNCMMEQKEILVESILNYVIIVGLSMTLVVPLGLALYHLAKPGD